MMSSAVYRFRAMPPPSVGWNPNSRLDLVYRGQVSDTRFPKGDFIDVELRRSAEGVTPRGGTPLGSLRRDGQEGT